MNLDFDDEMTRDRGSPPLTEAENYKSVVGHNNEDSGFSSIANSESISGKEGSVNTIIKDVEFATNSFDLDVQKDQEKKRRAIAEKKRAEREAFHKEQKEKSFKCLSHLLSRSKFYSEYLYKKFDESVKVQKGKNKGKRKNQKTDDEDVSPRKKSKASEAKETGYNLKDAPVAIKKKLEEGRRKLNMSQEDIEEELMDDDNNASETSESKSFNLENFVPPENFLGELYDYQKEGLQWMKVLYENGLSGILADEMGLGKTVQIIALIAHLIEKKIPGPYLIVVPLSTLSNWQSEFEKFTPHIPFVTFHGQDRMSLKKDIKKKYNINGFKTAPVVLTTFEVPAREKPFLRSMTWKYLIVDEAQRIKNYECQLIGVLKSLETENRLLLTGTPLQNSLKELWSLLNFLLPSLFNDLSGFESWFDLTLLGNEEGTKEFLKQEEEKQAVSKLREILKPFMLRRVKADVFLGIPPKKEVVVYSPMTKLQYDLYKAVLESDISALTMKEESSVIIETPDGSRPRRKCRMNNKYAGDYYNTYKILELSRNSMPGTSTSFSGANDSKEERELATWSKYVNFEEVPKEFILNIKLQNRAMMYRKIVNHPYMIHWPTEFGLPKVNEELVRASGKLLVLDAMLARLKAGGHKVLLFATLTMILDVIEDYLSMRSYKYVRLDGSYKIEDRKVNIDSFNKNEELFLFLISTRAGGTGLNLAAADTVIIYDSDWNPQVDIQAMARCHRIGQTRPVVIYRLCTKGTIDETIIKVGESKRKLEKMVISKPTLNTRGNLMALKNLLESSELNIVSAENNVFAEEELDRILDRSDLIQEWKNSNLNK